MHNLSESFGCKVTKEIKTYCDETISIIRDNYPDYTHNYQALKKVFTIYNERIEQTEDNTILATEIQNALTLINCTYLSYESDANGFMCNEFIFRKKKGDSIAFDPQLVLKRCNDCKKGKAQQKENTIEKLLQKDSIKKILDLRKVLMTMIGDGFEVEAFICKGDMLEQNAVYFSMDGKHLPCPLADEAKEVMPLVSISEVCEEKLNPTTYSTPCENLINLFHRVYIPDFVDLVKEAQQDLPQIEEKKQAKIIDADVTVIDEQPIEKPEDDGGEES